MFVEFCVRETLSCNREALFQKSFIVFFDEFATACIFSTGPNGKEKSDYSHLKNLQLNIHTSQTLTHYILAQGRLALNAVATPAIVIIPPVPFLEVKSTRIEYIQ